MNRIRRVLIVLFLLITIGCAQNINVPVADVATRPFFVTRQLPMKAAVVLPPENSVYTKTNEFGGMETTPTGKLIRKSALEAFSRLFADVEFVEGQPYPEDAAIVVIPTIEEMTNQGIQVALGFGMKFDATATAKVIVTDREGMRIWSHTRSAKGTSRDVVSPIIPVAELIGEASALAIQTVLQDAAREISLAREITDYAGKGMKANAAGPAVSDYSERAHAGRTDYTPANTPVSQTQIPVPLTPSKPSATEALPSARPDTFAVVIGIDYGNRDDIPALTYASKDAAKVLDVLTDLRYGGVPKENTIFLLNEKATRSQMISALRKAMQWKGYVYIYFTGHGSPKLNEQKLIDAMIVPSDAVISDPESLEETAIAISYIKDLVDRSKSKGILIVLDACFSGGGKSILAKGSKPLVLTAAAPELLKPATAGKVIITSSSANQQSWEDDSELKGGIFSHYFIEGLKGKAGQDAWIRVHELFDYLKSSVPAAAQRLKRAEQTPQVSGTGNFQIARNWDKARVQDLEIVRGRLKKSFEHGYITAEQLGRALDELGKPTQTKLLKSFLGGKLSDKQFGALY